MDGIILKALMRILDNQVTIKEHIGIIKQRDGWKDNEYYLDSTLLYEMEEKLSEYRHMESED